MLVIKSTQKEIDNIKLIFIRKFKTNNLGLVSWYLDLKITYNILASKIFLY